tara:strand:+ start:982 stop:1650 length:669 start_codon:yes stop_codon:yes gene_type:complete
MLQKKLTLRQTKILEFIDNFIRQNSYPPTIREIGRACKISSTSVVNYNLNKLEEGQYISRSMRVSRGIQLGKNATANNIVPIPLIGRIFASEPVAYPQASTSYAPDETINLTQDIIGNPDGLFALEVRGDSMIDAMINNGDYVIIKQQSSVNNGDLAAIWLVDNEETTLKYFYKEKSTVRLQPANPTMDAIYVDPLNVRIQGKVILILRTTDSTRSLSIKED